jgi:serine/threonine-protein kinase HipA
MLVRVGDTAIAGAIVNEGDKYLFTYDRDVMNKFAVSLTMPISAQSYEYGRELHPIFQMNLPEGDLRAALTTMFRKALSDFNDLDLLRVMGYSQIGRLRYMDSNTPRTIPTQSVEEILRHQGTDDLMAALLEKFAQSSGVSGVQPKVLLKDSALDRLTVQGTTHIVKTFDENKFPQLAANEFFCMMACERAGLPVAKVALSDNGRFLIIDRFDISEDSSYLGVEDFCALNGLGTDRKYSTTYEALAKRIRQYVSEHHRRDALFTYFKSVAMSCAIRNGDAHLKNFAVLYEDATSTVTLAPTFDMVTTCAYIKDDTMALTLGSSKRFTSAKHLINFGKIHCGMTETETRTTLEQIGQAVSETKTDVIAYAKENKRFEKLSEAMIRSWDEGLALSIRVDSPRI